MHQPDREAQAGARGATRAATGGILSSLVAVLGLMLLPKCPLCVAALLGAAGLGAGATSLMAPLLRPAALLLVALALVRMAWIVRRARRARAGTRRDGSCCERDRPPYRAGGFSD